MRRIEDGELRVRPFGRGVRLSVMSIPPRVSSRTPMTRGVPKLREREMQVLVSLILGKTNREIGRELHLAEKTVTSYVTSIFRKLGVSNRAEAAIVGMEIFPMLRGLAIDLRP
jgi:DNA-binding NarL/FixJ family response regulator